MIKNQTFQDFEDVFTHADFATKGKLVEVVNGAREIISKDKKVSVKDAVEKMFNKFNLELETPETMSAVEIIVLSDCSLV